VRAGKRAESGGKVRAGKRAESGVLNSSESQIKLILGFHGLVRVACFEDPSLKGDMG
jgi:hypothetical protein